MVGMAFRNPPLAVATFRMACGNAGDDGKVKPGRS